MGVNWLDKKKYLVWWHNEKRYTVAELREIKRTRNGYVNYEFRYTFEYDAQRAFNEGFTVDCFPNKKKIYKSKTMFPYFLENMKSSTVHFIINEIQTDDSIIDYIDCLEEKNIIIINELYHVTKKECDLPKKRFFPLYTTDKNLFAVSISHSLNKDTMIPDVFIHRFPLDRYNQNILGRLFKHGCFSALTGKMRGDKEFAFINNIPIINEVRIIEHQLNEILRPEYRDVKEKECYYQMFIKLLKKQIITYLNEYNYYCQGYSLLSSDSLNTCFKFYQKGFERTFEKELLWATGI